MSSDSGGSAGEPVSRADLVRFFHEAGTRTRGATPKIGVEHELLPVHPETGAAVPYSGKGGVETVFRDLLSQGFEQPPPASTRPTQAVRGSLAIDIEPGAQTEVSGSPYVRLSDVERELVEAWDLLRDAGARAGFKYLSHGVTPLSLVPEIEQVPKRRYAIMAAHFQAMGGPRALDMMRRTGSVQASFDFEDEADAGRKLRAALLTAPVFAAIFANAPVSAGRVNGLKSERTQIWLGTDDARSGLIREACEGSWSFDRYVDFALRVPTILVRADDGGVASAGGKPFGALLAEGVSGRPITRGDWDLHLSTIFTDARLKRVVEVRACDAPRRADAMAVPALATGIIYDRGACEAAIDVCAPLYQDWSEWKREVARDGLAARLPGRTPLLDRAREVARIAAGGLRARGFGEERYLVSVEAAVAAGRGAAERVIDAFARTGMRGLIEDAAI